MTGGDAARRPAAFLDRDGTIIEERHYLGDPDEAALLPGAAHGLRTLAGLGYRLIVVSNQSGIGRGLLTRATVERVNKRVDALLRAEGVAIAAWYLCPHAPGEACGCRKPLPGMVDRAARDWPIDLRSSIVIGDKDADLGLAAARGMTGYLVLTGHGREHAGWADAHGFAVFDDLAAVAGHVARPAAALR